MSLAPLHQLMRLHIEGDWRHYAQCAGEDPALFFPRGHTGPWQHVIDDAKTICGGCPVIEQCLTWALETGEEHGVWGGYDEREIAAIRRKRARRRSKNRRDEVTS